MLENEALSGKNANKVKICNHKAIPLKVFITKSHIFALKPSSCD